MNSFITVSVLLRSQNYRGCEGRSVQEAGACLGLSQMGSSGRVYETHNGVFADTFFELERRGPVPSVRARRGSPYKDKRRNDL